MCSCLIWRFLWGLRARLVSLHECLLPYTSSNNDVYDPLESQYESIDISVQYLHLGPIVVDQTVIKGREPKIALIITTMILWYLDMNELLSFYRVPNLGPTVVE